MKAMQSRKISISDLRSVIDDLAVLEPDLTISSAINFDLLKNFHDLAMKRHFAMMEQTR